MQDTISSQEPAFSPEEPDDSLDDHIQADVEEAELYANYESEAEAEEDESDGE